MRDQVIANAIEAIAENARVHGSARGIDPTAGESEHLVAEVDRAVVRHLDDHEDVDCLCHRDPLRSIVIGA
jgi:hypothetical protein